MEDDFYATIKLKTGEEIFAKVAASEEEDNPIIVSEVKGRSGTMGYRVEPWLKTTSEDMFIINLTDILTLSESSDIEMIMVYQQYVRRPLNKGDNQTKISKKMGYVTNVNDAKEVLEKIFKIS